ncbi:MerR family transcriptional regulator [Clostridioides difficile]|uniref:MerR family transcriptional regulator n=1 Tax=Clostridioides difficile TaxID=1496 RepID=UPI00093BF0AF|nr:MerR family transcriptional regulator [Clostridioides difficile]TQX30903.1 MerR family transcriptional regulator [Clostridioides difficile]
MKYSITDVSKITKISSSAIRFYEEKGLLLPINRKPSGVRYFSEGDVERLIFIKELKDTGLSIKDIHECFHFCDMGDGTIDKRIQLFQQHKQNIKNKIHELENCMDKIDEKIYYLKEKKMCKK